jgi:hypothetical protein
MMDDIDRLDKAEIQTVFRLVKLLADFPNTTYVLFFDDKRVAEALGEKYVGDGAGKSFLEKIIQVPLSLPPASRQARREIALEGLQSALALAKFDLSEDDARRLGEIFDKGFLNRITTPRVAKRFGNALNFALPVLVGETDIVDLILIEGLRILYPEVYFAIRDNGDAFSPNVTDPLNLIRDSDRKKLSEEIIKGALESYSEADRKAAGVVIQALFPRIAADLFRAGPYVSDLIEGRSTEKRIASNEYFPRYFNYGVPSDDISDREVEKFLSKIPGEAIDKLLEDFRSLCSNNRAHVLIEKLRSKEDTVQPDAAGILALVVGLSGESFPYSHPTDRFFGFGTMSQASALIRHLLHRIEDQSSRESLAIELAQRIEPLPFAYDYSSWMRRIKKSDYSEEMVSVVSEQTEDRIREIVVRRIATFAEQEPIERKYPHDAQQMYRLWEFVNKKSLRDYLQRRIKANPSEAAEFISAATGIDPNSETSRDWQEDLGGWFGFICDLISPDQIMETLRVTYPQLANAKYDALESHAMNNRERAARWFQRLYAERLKQPTPSGAEQTMAPTIESKISLEPVLSDRVTFRSDERDECSLDISIKNTGRRPVNQYRLEVEFPAEFLNNDWHPHFEESERKSGTHRFFRMTEAYINTPSKQTIYPGDSRHLMSIPYYLYEQNKDSLEQKLWVTIYVDDAQIRSVETPMREFVGRPDN